MTRASLAGCWAKLARAEEQLNGLETELAKHVEANPYPISKNAEQRPGNWYDFVYESEPKLPLRFGVVVGEIVHDLRSSLDHLVRELVRLNQAVSTPDHQFPVCELERPTNIPGDRRRAWTVMRPKALKSVHPDHVAIIQGLQPYQRRSKAHSDPLFALNQLWNTDKHRIIHSALLDVTKEHPAEVTLDLGGYAGVTLDIVNHVGRVKRGAPALSIRIVKATLGTPKQVKVNGKFPVAIRFGPCRVGTIGLRELGWHVSQNVLGAFSQFFPRTKDRATPFDERPPRPAAVGRITQGLPADTDKRFGKWKIWFDGDVVGVDPNSGDLVQVRPSWYVQVDETNRYAIRALDQTREGLRKELVALVREPVVDEVLAYFEPTVRQIGDERFLTPV